MLCLVQEVALWHAILSSSNPTCRASISQAVGRGSAVPSRSLIANPWGSLRLWQQHWLPAVAGALPVPSLLSSNLADRRYHLPCHASVVDHLVSGHRGQIAIKISSVRLAPALPIINASTIPVPNPLAVGSSVIDNSFGK